MAREEKEFPKQTFIILFLLLSSSSSTRAILVMNVLIDRNITEIHLNVNNKELFGLHP